MTIDREMFDVLEIISKSVRYYAQLSEVVVINDNVFFTILIMFLCLLMLVKSLRNY